MTKFVDPKKWTFLKEGADDFRSGIPPCTNSGVLTKGAQGLTPVLMGNKKATKKLIKIQSKSHLDTTDSDHDHSRLTVTQRQRIHNVEAIEHILKQHPLALYPHLEECLPPELFEDVVSVLDPEMTLITDNENKDAENEKSGEERPAVYTIQANPDELLDNQTPENEEIKMVNPYRWLPEADEVDKRDKKSLAEQQKNFLKNEDEEHIKNVTQQFCEWVASLGGDSNNIDESTVTSLFASGYETKPALSVPIHVIELESVPAELRMSAMATFSASHQSTGQKLPNQDGNKSGSAAARSSKKCEYGAWYLEPQTWKKRPAGESLRDPNDTKDKDISEAKQRSLQLDHELAPMNGVKLFMEFVDKKDSRRPEFLNHVSEIQAEQQSEEQSHNETDVTKPKTPGTKNLGLRQTR